MTGRKKRPHGVYVNGILGEILRDLASRETVEQLSERINMTAQRISYLRTGRIKNPKLSDVEKLANAAGGRLTFEKTDLVYKKRDLT